MVQRQKRKCVARSKRSGKQCRSWAIEGATCCRMHLANPKARENAAVRAEVMHWGLLDETEDPGEVLLRLVTQSANRVRKYSALLQEAYDAAERLRAGYEAQKLMIVPEDAGDPYQEPGDDEDRDGPEHPAIQRAREDLDRVFLQGGVSALIGNTYSATTSGHVYATGEAIRGLQALEAAERDRCANFAAKAVAAGLKEREVRLAERQGQQILDLLTAVLGELGLDDELIDRVPDLIDRHLVAVGG